MSWFARSIANTLNFNEEDEDDDHSRTDSVGEKNPTNSSSSTSPLSSPGRGVKEDFSELTQTLTRQFWGVASFLAPPPPVENQQISESDPDGAEAADPEGISGIRSDLAEIGGKFRTGISNLSKNIDVSEITKMASNFLQLGLDEDEYDSIRESIGVTDDVLAFVEDIAMYPGTWLDFPLSEDEHDEDFILSDAQQEHALAVERLVPRLAALRMELCPSYISESRYWKIYFVLLHPRLDAHDALLLSTPDIMKARASLTLELKNRNKAHPEEALSNTVDSYPKNISETLNSESLSVPPTPLLPSAKSEPATDKHPVHSSDINIIDKSVIQEEPVNQTKDQDSLPGSSSSRDIEIKDEDDGDDWLKEENSEMGGASGPTTIPINHDEDVSFSDLEEDDDDDDGDVPTSYKRVTHCSDSSTKGSADWVQLSQSSDGSAKENVDSVPVEHSVSGQVSAHNDDSKESNDWLDIDEIDVA